MTHSKPWSASCVVLWKSKGAKSKLTPTCGHQSSFDSQRESDCPRDIDTRRNCAGSDSVAVMPPNVFASHPTWRPRDLLFPRISRGGELLRHARLLSRTPGVNLLSG